MSDDKRSFDQLVVADLQEIKTGVRHLTQCFEQHARDDAQQFGAIQAQIQSVQNIQNQKKWELKGMSKVIAWTGGTITLVGACLGIVWTALNIMEKLGG